MPLAGTASASQTVIVLHTPLLPFLRRQAGRNWGGTGDPEIKSFYELPDLAERGTWLTGTDDGQSPLPGSFCEKEALPSSDGRCWHPPGRLELGCLGREVQPRRTLADKRRKLYSPFCAQPHISANTCSENQVWPSLLALRRLADCFSRFFWKFLLTTPGKKKVKRTKRKSKKTSSSFV